MGFFVDKATYEREIEWNGEKGKVTMRRLDAGDQAAIQDTLRMSMDEGADSSMAIGTMRMITVNKALVDWDFDGPKPSPEAIAQLEPDVFEKIYDLVEMGTPPTSADTAEPSASNGEAETTAPAIEKAKPVTAPLKSASES